MMELGACICTVHQPPACKSCPISVHCQAYQDVQDYVDHGGQVSDLEAPTVTQYPSKVSTRSLVAVIRQNAALNLHLLPVSQVACLKCKLDLFSNFYAG